MFDTLFNSLRFLLETDAKQEKIRARVAAEQKVRLAEMAKDPLRQKFVAKIEAGDYWWDEDITYNIDVNATNVCEHLRPIEQLMRAQEIDLRRGGGNRIQAFCLIDFPKLKAQLSLPDLITYSEPHIPDRSMLDPRSSIIWCTNATCESSIFGVHPDEGKTNVPPFPR